MVRLQSVLISWMSKVVPYDHLAQYVWHTIIGPDEIGTMLCLKQVRKMCAALHVALDFTQD